MSCCATLLAMCSAGCTSGTKADTATSLRQEIFFADPTVYAEDGIYYLTGTRNAAPAGFVMLRSDDLQNWTYMTAGDSMILRAGTSVFGDKGFWAPQILRVDSASRYWLTYTANEQTAIAYADSLGGLFAQEKIAPIDSSEKNIDSFLFRDDDGRWYLYHVRFDHGNFLWVAEFDPASGRIDPATLTQCFRNDQPWEHTGAYPSDPIMEGPTVVRIGSKYYLFYSANHFMSRDYAVGYATADSPTGPWTKNPSNPIIHRSIVGENGSGHGDLFTDRDGNYRYVYHVHNSDSIVAPRRTRIVTLSLDYDSLSGVADIRALPSTILRPVIED